MRGIARFALFAAALIGVSSAASAGILDKLSEATKKMNQATQKSQQSQGGSGGNFGGSLSAGLGATDFSALDKHNKECLGKLDGYKAKISGDVIEKKLSTDKTLTPAQRKNLEEDLVGLRTAQANGTDLVEIAGQKNSNRYLVDISMDEQSQINQQYAAYYNEIVSECQGRDHMNSGITRKMNYVQDNSATQESTARGAMAMSNLQSCMAQVQPLRWKLFADRLEPRWAAASGKEKKELEEDLLVLRQAQNGGATAMPQSPDPKNPMRYMTRFSAQDQMAINQEYSTLSQQMIADCSAQADVTAKSPERQAKSGGLVDHSKSPSNPNAPKNKPRKAAVGTGIGGSTNLEYMRRTAGCENPIKGHLAKVTADTLEAKLKAAGNIPPQKRQEWEADIAAWRAAEQAGADKAMPVDPDNPFRWYDYVTSQERAKINQEHAAFSADVMRECAKQDAGL
jgi:hypothetical protein